jgi:cob(I)alamin adenosyltransferase
MVKLTKIYTKTGDDGNTMLGDGSRTRKTHARVEAYGAVDEANAAIGLAICHLDEAERDDPELTTLTAELRRIQNDLFDVGADLCVPQAKHEEEGQALRVTPDQTERLERSIDQVNAKLDKLESFILPGGSKAAAALHVARTTTRRAERRVAFLIDAEEARVNPEALTYLNRLSDLLFVFARAANQQGRADVLWVPGANRE